MRKNPFIAIGYWMLFAVNLWAGVCFAAFYPDQLPASLLAEISQLTFALRMMEILNYICRNWRNGKPNISLKRRTAYRALILSGISYLLGICLLLWSAPNVWTFIFGHLLLLVGGYHLGKRLAEISDKKGGGPAKDDQLSS